MNDSVMFGMYIASDLRNRLRKTAKRIHRSSSEVARDAIEAHLEMLEAKFRIEEAHKEEEKKKKKSLTRPTLKTLKRLGENPVIRPKLNVDEKDVEEDEAQDRLNRVYGYHAARLLDVGESDPVEKRIRLREAIEAIHREAPLTFPQDDEIIRILEKFMLMIRAEIESKKQEKKVEVDTEVDVTKVKTHGIVENDE